MREKSDYDDFYIAGKQETETQLTDAEHFVEAAGIYLKQYMG